MKELKLCHHCGCAEIGPLNQDECWELGGHRYECYSCGAHGPWRKTLEEAREAWNTRADGWIKVSDEPIPFDHYVKMGLWEYNRDTNKKHWREYDLVYDSVENHLVDMGIGYFGKWTIDQFTHYRYLPEPPKGE